MRIVSPSLKTLHSLALCNNRVCAHEFVPEQTACLSRVRRRERHHTFILLSARFTEVFAGLLAAWLIGSCAAIGASNVRAADTSHPAVVELFQSQGRSSCPPANANANALSERADVLALASRDLLGPSWLERHVRQTPVHGAAGASLAREALS
jgi:hypothetical protein